VFEIIVSAVTLGIITFSLIDESTDGYRFLDQKMLDWQFFIVQMQVIQKTVTKTMF
jgi:hypothetical protein